MTLTTKNMAIREDGNLQLTVTQGSNQMSVTLDSRLLLQVMKIDLNRATAAQTLVREAHSLLLGALTTNTLNKETVGAWMKKYEKLMVGP